MVLKQFQRYHWFRIYGLGLTASYTPDSPPSHGQSSHYLQRLQLSQALSPVCARHLLRTLSPYLHPELDEAWTRTFLHYMSYSLNSFTGINIGDYIGDYYRGY